MRFSFVFIGLVFVGLAGCKVKQPVTTETRDSISYVEKIKLDTILIGMPGDSALMAALVECDSNGFAQLIEISALTGRLENVLSVKNGRLQSRCICKDDSLLVVISSLNSQLREKKTEKIHTITNTLTKAQKNKIAGFWLLCVLLVFLFWLRIANKI